MEVFTSKDYRLRVLRIPIGVGLAVIVHFVVRRFPLQVSLHAVVHLRLQVLTRGGLSPISVASEDLHLLIVVGRDDVERLVRRVRILLVVANVGDNFIFFHPIPKDS